MAEDSRKNPENSKSFESILEDLEGIVSRLEGGELELEDSLSAFEAGIRLVREGEQRLAAAERRVEELLSNGEGLEMRDWVEKEP